MSLKVIPQISKAIARMERRRLLSAESHLGICGIRSRGAAQGMTLTEVLVAIALSGLVVVGLGLTDVGRFRMQEAVRRQATTLVSQTQPALASRDIGRSLERADRIVIRDSGIAGVNPRGTPPGPGKIQMRYPTCPSPATPACLANAANYAWEEYRLNGTTLERLLSTGCATPEVLAVNISGLTFRFKDEVDPAPPAPPGGYPFFPDTSQNNVVEYSFLWSQGGRMYEFRGKVTSRSIPYAALNATLGPSLGDSGTGLLPAGAVPDPC